MGRVAQIQPLFNPFDTGSQLIHAGVACTCALCKWLHSEQRIKWVRTHSPPLRWRRGVFLDCSDLAYRRQPSQSHCQFLLVVILIHQLAGEIIHIRLHIEMAMAGQIEQD